MRRTRTQPGMSEEKVAETARWLLAHAGTVELHAGGRGGRALLSSHSGFVAYPLVQLLHSASATTAAPLLHLVLWLTRTSPELLVTSPGFRRFPPLMRWRCLFAASQPSSTQG